MNRKGFLINTVPLSLASTLSLSHVLKGCSLHWPKQSSAYDGRVLVLIQMDGGNDGLNTVIPLDQYTNLTVARKNLLIPDKKVLALNNSSVTGLHPAMPALHEMYNNRQLTIVQGAGYSNPDLSHFKAIDIWNTGSDSASAISVQTGWLGRYLDQNHNDNNAGDPPAIMLNPSLSKTLQGELKNAGMVVRSLQYFYDIKPGSFDAKASQPGKQLRFLRTAIRESKDYLARVMEASERQISLSKKYPLTGSNDLADQLKIVARLIGGGLQTGVYLANLGGFDTHADQVDAADTTQGAHARLLAKLSEAVGAFEDDLLLMGLQDRVLGMTFSEFGRRIKSNANNGSDHGTSAPVLLFGSKLKGGVIGNNPEIPPRVTVHDNLALQYDFRSLYASILKNWMGVTDTAVNTTLFGNYPYLDLFKS